MLLLLLIDLVPRGLITSEGASISVPSLLSPLFIFITDALEDVGRPMFSVGVAVVRDCDGVVVGSI